MPGRDRGAWASGFGSLAVDRGGHRVVSRARVIGGVVQTAHGTAHDARLDRPRLGDGRTVRAQMAAGRQVRCDCDLTLEISVAQAARHALVWIGEVLGTAAEHR